MKETISAVAILAMMLFGLSACEKGDTTTPVTAVVATDSVEIPFATDHYVFYSLREGKVVPLSDSASTSWDIGMKFTTIILNSHASGPGEGGVIVKTDNQYSTLTQAPATGYAYDTLSTNSEGDPVIKYAIDWSFGSPSSWYIYDAANHLVTSKAGLYFIVRTADGKYAKLEIPMITYADYTEGAMFPNTLVYKLNYVYQDNGSTDLSE